MVSIASIVSGGQQASGQWVACLEAPLLGLLGDHLHEQQRAARQHHLLPQLPGAMVGVPGEHEAASPLAVGPKHEYRLLRR